jgi:UDP-N-acetylmuramyl pentapeptide phosphotransferase/UDP-N-acetylglucosamine-1-phosphate transferase
MFWKKVFKKKLFPIAPFHHYLERKGHHECSIVMKLRFIQGILAITAIVFLMGQYM